MMFVSWVLLLVLSEVHCRLVQHPQLMITQGILQGRRYQAERGTIYHGYTGIPFGESPTGALRLQDPLPARGWPGIRDASWNPPRCPQMKDGEVIGSEDCLFLNVYAPEEKSSVGGHTVMVYIHGGEFLTSGIDGYSPLPLMDYGIILVVFQYRLGVLGFLSMEDSVLPGNLGLKDQTLALKWVKDNIRDFGGDPNKVTIFGQGSGAYSVHYQLLTPYARGLFSRAILQSGTALCPKYPLEGHFDVARKIAQKLGCGGDKNSERTLSNIKILQCLQSLQIKDLVPVYESLEVWNGMPFSMTPRVDGDYIPDDPTKLVASGNFSKVDLLLGMTQDDGGLLTSSVYSNLDVLQAIGRDFPKVGPISLGFQNEHNAQHLAAINYVYYLDNVTKPLDVLDADNITKMFTDRFVSVCTDFTAVLHAREGVKVRVYELQHRGLASATDKFQLVFDNKWIVEGDDLQYLFRGSQGFPPLRIPGDLKTGYHILKLWTNFAKTGDPTPDSSLGYVWEPVVDTSVRFLALSPEPEMQEDYRAMLRTFWLSLPIRQNKIIYPEDIGHFEIRSYQEEDDNHEAKMVFVADGLSAGDLSSPGTSSVKFDAGAENLHIEATHAVEMDGVDGTSGIYGVNEIDDTAATGIVDGVEDTEVEIISEVESNPAEIITIDNSGANVVVDDSGGHSSEEEAEVQESVEDSRPNIMENPGAEIVDKPDLDDGESDVSDHSDTPKPDTQVFETILEDPQDNSAPTFQETESVTPEDNADGIDTQELAPSHKLENSDPTIEDFKAFGVDSNEAINDVKYSAAYRHSVVHLGPVYGKSEPGIQAEDSVSSKTDVKDRYEDKDKITEFQDKPNPDNIVKDYVYKNNVKIHTAISDDIDTHANFLGVGSVPEAREKRHIDGAQIENDIDTHQSDHIESHTQVPDDTERDAQAANELDIDSRIPDIIKIDAQTVDDRDANIYTAIPEDTDVNAQGKEIVSDTPIPEDIGTNTQTVNNGAVDTQIPDNIGTNDIGTDMPVSDNINTDTQVPVNIGNHTQVLVNIDTHTEAENDLESDTKIPDNVTDKPGPDTQIPDIGSDSQSSNNVDTDTQMEDNKGKQPADSDFLMVKKMINYGDIDKILRNNAEAARNYNALNRVAPSMCDINHC